jgi:hypothetical protein
MQVEGIAASVAFMKEVRLACEEPTLTGLFNNAYFSPFASGTTKNEGIHSYLLRVGLGGRHKSLKLEEASLGMARLRHTSSILRGTDINWGDRYFERTLDFLYHFYALTVAHNEGPVWKKFTTAHHVKAPVDYTAAELIKKGLSVKEMPSASLSADQYDLVKAALGEFYLDPKFILPYVRFVKCVEKVLLGGTVSKVAISARIQDISSSAAL